MALFAFVKRRQAPAPQPTPEAPPAPPKVPKDELVREACWMLARISTDVGLGETAEVSIRLMTERALYLTARLGEDLAVLALETSARQTRLDLHVRTCVRCKAGLLCTTLASLRRETARLERQLDFGRRFLASVP
jgi:hypothetical protein